MAAFRVVSCTLSGNCNCSVGQVLYSLGRGTTPVYYGLCLSHSVVPFSLSLVAGLDFLQHLPYVFYVLAFFMMGHLEQAFLRREYSTAVPGHFSV